jgi:hypothetical protein
MPLVPAIKMHPCRPTINLDDFANPTNVSTVLQNALIANLSQEYNLD